MTVSETGVHSQGPRRTQVLMNMLWDCPDGNGFDCGGASRAEGPVQRGVDSARTQVPVSRTKLIARSCVTSGDCDHQFGLVGRMLRPTVAPLFRGECLCLAKDDEGLVNRPGTGTTLSGSFIRTAESARLTGSTVGQRSDFQPADFLSASAKARSRRDNTA